MSEANATTEHEALSREDMMSALFAHMVVQQSNLAMMLMGKVNHPETGKPVKDLESARLFIDQLEMLEQKTKGNLSKQEENLLKQSLMNLRMAFVESANTPAEGAAPETPEAAKPADAGTAASAAEPAKEESHKKFSKKY